MKIQLKIIRRSCYVFRACGVCREDRWMDSWDLEMALWLCFECVDHSAAAELAMRCRHGWANPPPEILLRNP